jgi:hypothetical protein
MASSSRKKTTMAKLNRERNVRERRVIKKAKKEARKNAVLYPADVTSDTLNVEDPTSDTPGIEDPTTEPPNGALAAGLAEGQLAQAKDTPLT